MSFDNNKLCIDYDVCGIINGWSLNNKNITTLDSPYSMETTDVIIFADASLGPITVDLTKCHCKERPSYIIRKVDSSTNDVTILPQAGATIQGLGSYVLTRQYQTQWLSFDITTSTWKSITNLPEDVLTTKGDLMTFGDDGVVALPVGVDGQVLVADSTQPSGLRYANGGGGGEINSGANVGTGVGKVYQSKVGTVLQFRSIAAGSNIAITNGATDITINYNVLTESISTSVMTALNPAAELSQININTTTGGGTTLTTTLANGTTIGQRKVIAVNAVSGADKYQVNITTFVNGTGILFDNLGDSAELVWTTTGWALISSNGALVIGGIPQPVTAYTIVTMAVDASTTGFTTLGYFPFNISRHYTYNRAVCLYNAVISGTNGTIRVYNSTTATVIGSAVVTVSGQATFALTLPFANATLEIQLKKNTSGGTHPRFLGIVFEFM